jgi:hypothetical protein
MGRGAEAGVAKPGVKADSAGAKTENEGVAVGETVSGALIAGGMSGWSGEGKSAGTGAGEDGVGAASAGATG